MTSAGVAVQSKAELVCAHVALQSTYAEAQETAAFNGETAQMQRAARDLKLGCSGWSETFCYSGHALYDGDHLLADTMDHIEQVLQRTTPSKRVSGNMRSMQRCLHELSVINVAKRCHHLSRHIR